MITYRVVTSIDVYLTGDILGGATGQLRSEDVELLEMLDNSAAGVDKRVGSGSLSHRSLSTNLSSSRASSAATLTCGNMAKYSLQQLCHLGKTYNT